MEVLTKAGITTMLPVKDMERAGKFYENNLGLKSCGATTDGFLLFEAGNGAQIGLIPKDEGTKAEHTALSFEVNNIEEVISQLQDAGVVFEDYDFPNLKTVNHIRTAGPEKTAWFKDTEGNYLCIHEVVE
mgnify:CR=1 FL=1